MWKHVSGASKQKEKQKWTIEKLELDAWRLRGIYLKDREDKEFKDIMKKARGRLEIPLPAAMLCKTSVCRSSRETCGTIGEHKTKYVCIVEADESLRIRMEGSPHRYHEDHIAEKGMNSMTHYSLVHKFVPVPQAMKVPDAGAAVETEWEKLEKLPAWQLTKVRNKNEVLAEARNEGRKVHFAPLMDLCHLENSELDPQFQKYKGRVVLTMIQDLMLYFLNKDHQHHKRRPQKEWTSLQDYQDAQDKQQTFFS